MRYLRLLKLAALGGLCVFINLYLRTVFNDDSARILSISLFIILSWVLEILPIPVVSLFPLILYPLFSVSSLREVSTSYSSPLIFLFLGGFILSLAIEKWDLHKRLALNLIHATGTQPKRILLGLIFATGLLSMWISNSSTAVLMLPIAISVIYVLEENGDRDQDYHIFSSILLMSIAYAANIGGMATPIGSPPNVAFIDYLSSTQYGRIDFVHWFTFGFPICIVLLVVLYFVMCFFIRGMKSVSSLDLDNFILLQKQNLGPMSYQEIAVTVIFGLTALLWISKGTVSSFTNIPLDDSIIAMIGATLLFVFPSNPKGGDGALLEWADTKNLAWGILLLIGASLALGAQLEKTELLTSFANILEANFSGNQNLLAILVILIAIILSNLMSNLALVVIFAPVLGELSQSLNYGPEVLMLPMVLACSCAFMLPMGTPPNAIIFASGRVKMKNMLIAGSILSFIMTFAIFILIKIVFS